MAGADLPLISCVVPVFNGERYLGEALDSILAQTYRPLEIIVVNDGSTDGTEAIAGRYGDQIRYFGQQNAGPAAARNRGLSAMLGDFVAFLDADDLWHREKLERQMTCFGARPELDYCVTHIQNFWVPELREEEEKFRDHRIRRPAPGYITATLLARRIVFERVGKFNTSVKYGDAAEWFLRAKENRAVGELLPDVLTYRRLHQANRTRLQGAASREQFLKIVKDSLDRRRRENS